MVQKSRFRRVDTAFALNGLNENRAGAFTDSRRSRIHIIERAINKPAGQWFEAFVVFWLRGRGNRSESAPVESPFKSDNFTFFRTVIKTGIFAREFDGRFIGLGAGIAIKHPLRERRGID